MGKQLHYHVVYIAASRMRATGRDWIYLPGEEQSTLWLSDGADEKRAFDEVADMLDTGHAACDRWVA